MDDYNNQPSDRGEEGMVGKNGKNGRGGIIDRLTSFLGGGQGTGMSLPEGVEGVFEPSIGTQNGESVSLFQLPYSRVYSDSTLEFLNMEKIVYDLS